VEDIGNSGAVPEAWRSTVNVRLPIASVVPTVDGPVYVALAGTTAPMTATQVQRIAQRSLEGVRIVLRRMLRAGVVLEVPGGYVLNREHLAAPAIESLANLHGQLLERVRDTVAKWGGEVALVGLFGSAARRDGDEDSDIDIVVVSDAADLEEFTMELAASIRRWTGNDAQVIGVSLAEVHRLRRAQEPIVGRWEAELVVVCGSRSALKGVT
jgi:predicted nucleotidyltransferase